MPASVAPKVADLTKMLSIAVIAIALMTGAALRVVRLNQVPPALNQDEAVAGYDAYSILKTGRDHHGNFMPIIMQGFNDYRMPLFTYSLLPLVGALGLKTSVVPLCAALWGIVDLAALTVLAGLIWGWPGAAAAALIGTLMPWHLELSRYGIEATSASATISLGLVSFFLWLERRRDAWILLSCAFFALSLYSYSVAQASVPLLCVLLAVLYWPELKQLRVRTALVALAIGFTLALPLALSSLKSSTTMMTEYHHLSLFNPATICPGCDKERADLASSSIFGLLAANFASYFSPAFLFLQGSMGDHWTLLHPPGFGELLPEQAPLILLGLGALLIRRRRKIALLILGWLVFAVLPATLILPLGASYPEHRALPTPNVLFDYSVPPAQVTPALLLTHPDSRHAILSMAPWIMLSALGFVVLLDLTSRAPTLRMAAVALLLVGVIFHGGRFARSYFRDFPRIAAPYFQYGIKEFIGAIDQRYDRKLPVIITSNINQPYIYVLFFERYSPAAFQRGPVFQRTGEFGPVLHFDRYWFLPPNWAYPRAAHGIFVFRGIDQTPKPPDALIHYPDGTVAYKIVVK
ncbi:MAG TPA: hypothetical protein VJN94_09395 [Candidatus Binataceae bacterium]|nr:hypothetical protein [Candidatus Binataceae bacterium]